MPSEYRLCKYRGKFAVSWRDKSGRHRISLGTESRAEADRRLDIFIAERERANRPQEITVAYAWDGYRKTLGSKPAATTMGHEWKSIGPFFGERGAASISEKDCASYIAMRRKQGRSDGTVWTELGRLRSALRWAESKNLITKAPKIYRPERPPPRDKRLTREQVKAFRDACEYPHIRLFVTLAIATGARMSAILGLTWDRVDFEKERINLADPDLPRTKKGRAIVPMNAMARASLLEAREAATGAYVIEWGGRRVRSVKKALGTVGKACGLPWVTAHVFRHSAACAMAERGVPMAEIAQFLGHSDSRVTERVYARFSPQYLKNAAEALDFD